jgi:hypothetical protein
MIGVPCKLGILSETAETPNDREDSGHDHKSEEREKAAYKKRV